MQADALAQSPVAQEPVAHEIRLGKLNSPAAVSGLAVHATPCVGFVERVCRPSPSRDHRSRRLGSWLIILMALAGLPGCGGSEDRENNGSQRASSAAAQGRVDHLDFAMAFVFSDERFQPDAANMSIATSLNQWAEALKDTPPYEPDPMLETLSDEYQSHLDELELDALKFNQRDAELLQECRWEQALAEWMQQEDRFASFRYLFATTLRQLNDEERGAFQRADDRLAYLVAKRHAALDQEQAKQLATTLRIFDWITRNVQLVELLNPPTELEMTQLARVSSPNRSAPALGVPGPGYTLFPWQSLKFGRGDAWQRARLLILACRQMKVDGVMLAVAEGADGAPRPWLPAIRLGDQLYLFDTELGLALRASREEGGVATLSDLLADPSLLNEYAIDADDEVDTPEPYRVSESELQHVTALIDAAPAWLSHRMQTLEQHLTGNRRIILTLDANALAKRVEAVQGIESVKLWQLPFDTMIYRNVYERTVFRRPSDMIEYQLNELVFDLDTYLSTGRHRAILGMIENDEEHNIAGAKKIFSERRFPDEVIDELEANRDMQVRYGIDVDGKMTAEEKAAVIDDIRAKLRLIRAHASYWLALAHLESSKPATAVNWLKRVAEYDVTESWTSGTAYNLARAYEATGQFDQAEQLLRETPSPQFHGNVIRARWLEQLATQDSR